VIKVKKAAVWLGVLATIPVAFVLGFFIADPFYMRFIFEGERRDFAPGDSFGVLVWTLIFAVLLMTPAMLGWWHLYRRISKQDLSKA
jgi:hypothetical protein